VLDNIFLGEAGVKYQEQTNSVTKDRKTPKKQFASFAIISEFVRMLYDHCSLSLIIRGRFALMEEGN